MVIFRIWKHDKPNSLTVVHVVILLLLHGTWTSLWITLYIINTMQVFLKYTVSVGYSFLESVLFRWSGFGMVLKYWWFFHIGKHEKPRSFKIVHVVICYCFKNQETILLYVNPPCISNNFNILWRHAARGTQVSYLFFPSKNCLMSDKEAFECSLNIGDFWHRKPNSFTVVRVTICNCFTASGNCVLFHQSHCV